MSFWASPVRSPKARKEHRCRLCLQPITPGTVYDTWRCVIDGSMSSVKVHQSCWLLLREYGEVDPYEGYYEVSDEAMGETLRWAEPTREDCIRVAGDDGGRVWDLFLKPEDEDEADP